MIIIKDKKRILALLVLVTLLLALTSCSDAKSNQTANVNVGDIIEFGDYNWQVLDVDGIYALLILEGVYIIGNGALNVYWGPITWEATSTRRYLNNDFYYQFTEEDRGRIRETHVVTNDNPWFQGPGTSVGGNDTNDKIFILSIEEVVQYFGDSGQLDNRPEKPGWVITWISDEYDDIRLARTDDGAPIWWWLRSPGGYQRTGTGVDVVGNISLFGLSVSSTGGSIRPVMWVDMSGEVVHAETVTVKPQETTDICEDLYIQENLDEYYESDYIISRATATYWEGFNWEWEYFANVGEPLYLSTDTLHGDLAIQHLRFMNDNLYDRIPFSYREKETAAWLVEQFLAMGHPWENIYIQEFPIDGDMRWWNLNYQGRWRESNSELRHATQVSQNVILSIPGQSQQKIVVGAHYDSWPTPGAADNASGTALLLESAQRMLKKDHYYTIEYVFFGAHEGGGFWSSDFYLRNLTDEQADNIVLMINADALTDGPYMLYGAAYVYTDDYGNWLPGANEITRKVDAIATELELDIIGDPQIAFLGSDNKIFAGHGYTVVHMAGLYRSEVEGVAGFFYQDGGYFIRGVSHSPNDCYHVLEERWPGMIQRHLHGFSAFLERMLIIRPTS